MMRRPEHWKRKWGAWHLSIQSMYTFLIFLTLGLGLVYLIYTNHHLAPSLRSSQSFLLHGAHVSFSLERLATKGTTENHFQEIVFLAKTNPPHIGVNHQHASPDSLPEAHKSSRKSFTWKKHGKDSHLAVSKLTKVIVADALKNVSQNDLKQPNSQDSLQFYKNSFPSMMVNVTEISLNEAFVEKTLSSMCGEDRSVPRVDLVIMILSRIQGFERRQALRDTWLSPFIGNSSVVRHFFILGEDATLGKDVMKKLHQEMATHLDVVQAKINDSYDHLTYKTLLGFRLVSTWCRHARYVLKADHDVWVNVPSLLTFLHRFLFKPFEGLGGFCHGIRTPVRHPKSKYYISKQLYPDDKYPVFCNGPGYITTPQVAGQIVAVSSSVPFFRLEDIYVALCLRRLELKVRDIQGFAVLPGVNFSHQVTPELCRYHDDKVLLRHRIQPGLLRHIWAAGKCQKPGGQVMH